MKIFGVRVEFNSWLGCVISKVEIVKITEHVCAPEYCGGDQLNHESDNPRLLLQFGV